MMKAIWFDKFGPAAEVLQYGDLPMPSPGHGDVLVEMACSAPNPSDVKKRAGSFPELFADGPVIPHSDGAGTIVEVGPGVSAARIGERVWVYQAQFQRQHGTAAQFISVPSERAVWLPDAADFASGACMGIPAMTAHRCVFADGEVEGQNILVTGGAGRVGYYAIQWARLAGAQVIATASDDVSREDCMRAGADAVVNHRDADFVEQVRDLMPGGLVDRVVEVDFGKNLARNLELLAVSGTISTYASASVTEPTLPFFQMMYQDITLRFVIVYDMPEQAKDEAIEDITECLERGHLLHRVVHRLPLAETAAAHELIEKGGFRGCVVVDCDG